MIQGMYSAFLRGGHGRLPAVHGYRDRAAGHAVNAIKHKCFGGKEMRR